MTQVRVLQLAHDAALMRWAREYDKLKERPNNRIRQERERRRWAELIELEAMERQAREIEAGGADK